MNQPLAPLKFVAQYSSRTRRIALGIKRRDAAVLQRAALDMAPFVPAGAVLVPAPSHHGHATDMLELVQVLARLTGSVVADVVTGNPRPSVRMLKWLGRPIEPELFGFMASDRPSGPLLVVDNVYDTGTTANALAHLLQADGILVHSKVAG
jgi:predicted amidophosphoribosyltransferase